MQRVEQETFRGKRGKAAPFGATLALLLVVGGCAGGVRGAAHVAISVKSCPEVTHLLGGVATDWSASFGIEAGDAATLKSALDASQSLEKQAESIDGQLKSACDKLSGDLGGSTAATTTEEACDQASRLAREQKAKLGQTAAAGTPNQPDASATPDAEAAARYQTSLQSFAAALLVVGDTAANLKGALGSTRRAIELGVVTGQSVSAGDIGAAAAAVACILPPLVEARRRVTKLRQDFKLLTQLSKLAGVKLPQTPNLDEPVVAHTTVGRGAPPTVPAPIQGRVRQLFAFPDGGFAAQTERGVIALPGGEQLLSFNRGGGGVRIEIDFGFQSRGRTLCAVGAGRRVACLRSNPLFAGNESVGSELVLADTAVGLRSVARVSNQGRLTPDGIAFDPAGQLLYAYTTSDVQGNTRVESARVNRGGAEGPLPFMPSEDSLEQLGGSGRQDPPLQFLAFQGRELLLFHQGRQLLLAPLDQPSAAVEIAKLSAYDVRPVVGGDGVLYIFYYEPRSRTARVAASKDGVHFEAQILDGRESGWQLEAIPSDDGAIAVFYYFRNSYNKGLRTAALHDGKLTRSPLSILREDRWDAGWQPLLATDRQHQVWLSYLSNVDAGTRVWAHFDAPSSLLDYSMADIGNSEDEYKDWFVQVGAGAWYTWWGLMSPAPKAEELDGATVHDTAYRVEPALLLSANMEARIGPISAGLSYAQNYLDDAAKKLGNTSRLLSGSLQIEDLLPGHDVKAEGVWGHYTGRASRPLDGSPNEELGIDTNYIDVHLMALNQWRVKYGLAFSRFTVPTPLLAYTAGAGQTRYSFASSALRNVAYNNIDLAVGYSKLDYAAKYENHFFGPILDTTLSGGLALAAFDSIVTPAGNVDSEVALHGRLNVMLGWLWMERARSLAGLGFYLRPAYHAEAGLISNGPSRPKDREAKDAEKADVESASILYTLRHGPWLDAGLVW